MKSVLLRSQRLTAPVLAFAAILLMAKAAWACPGCKDALAANDGAGQGDLVAGYFWSILFMMSMPFAVLGTFCGSMFFAVRRARAQQAERAGDSPDDKLDG